MMSDQDLNVDLGDEETIASLEALIQDFSVPTRVSLTDEEERGLSMGERFVHYHEGQRLACWHFGSGPEVVLMHGWNSRGSHLLNFVNPLASAGFAVTLFDAPAHGESKGGSASPVHFASALRTLCNYLGGVHSVVGHSLGSAASLIAFRQGLKVSSSVHLCGPSSMSPIVNAQLVEARASDVVGKRFREWIEVFTGQAIVDADLPALTRGLCHPGFILHDKEDRIAPMGASVALHHAWKDSSFLPLHGLGHRRLLDDPAVVSRCVEFIRASVRA